ncbi:MAG: hypothetical protein ABSF77_12035 [Spirochaetia bacterium]|jgi:hypothetical protein
MKRRVLVVAVALLLCVAMGAFAAEKKSSSIPWLVNYNAPGQSAIDLTAGWTEFGLGVEGAYNLTMGQFDIGPIPLSWGITGAADVGFTYDLGLGAGGFATLNWGLDFGGIWRFDFRVGLGLGIGFDFAPSWYGSPFGLGIGDYFSSTWLFAEKMGLTLQEIYVYSFFGPGFYAYTLGVEFKL